MKIKIIWSPLLIPFNYFLFANWTGEQASQGRNVRSTGILGGWKALGGKLCWQDSPVSSLCHRLPNCHRCEYFDDINGDSLSFSKLTMSCSVSSAHGRRENLKPTCVRWNFMFVGFNLFHDETFITSKSLLVEGFARWTSEGEPYNFCNDDEHFSQLKIHCYHDGIIGQSSTESPGKPSPLLETLALWAPLC